ncbi:MAG: hypothetical protein AAFQ42_05450 [Pseudomonadota bacterium]
MSAQRLRLAVVTWIGVYPVLTVLAVLLDPLLNRAPVPLRTLVMSALLVPAMVFVVVPVSSAIFADWLAGADEGKADKVEVADGEVADGEVADALMRRGL